VSDAPLRVLVVDDEPLAPRNSATLGPTRRIEVVGLAADGVEAARLAEDLEPEVVFLDVQMPGVGGFEVARRPGDRAPTRRRRLHHGLRPVRPRCLRRQRGGLPAENRIDSTRLEQAVSGREAVRRSGPARIPAPLTNETLEQIVQMVAERQTRRERLALRVGERLLLVASDEVIYASVVDDTIVVVTGQVAARRTTGRWTNWHARLDHAVFWRVHRSHVVNINKIKEIVPWFSRNYILRMKDPKATEIPVTRGPRPSGCGIPEAVAGRPRPLRRSPTRFRRRRVPPTSPGRTRSGRLRPTRRRFRYRRSRWGPPPVPRRAPG